MPFEEELRVTDGFWEVYLDGAWKPVASVSPALAEALTQFVSVVTNEPGAQVLIAPNRVAVRVEDLIDAVLNGEDPAALYTAKGPAAPSGTPSGQTESTEPAWYAKARALLPSLPAWEELGWSTDAKGQRTFHAPDATAQYEAARKIAQGEGLTSEAGRPVAQQTIEQQIAAAVQAGNTPRAEELRDIQLSLAARGAAPAAARTPSAQESFEDRIYKLLDEGNIDAALELDRQRDLITGVSSTQRERALDFAFRNDFDADEMTRLMRVLEGPDPFGIQQPSFGAPQPGAPAFDPSQVGELPASVMATLVPGYEPGPFPQGPAGIPAPPPVVFGAPQEETYEEQAAREAEYWATGNPALSSAPRTPIPVGGAGQPQASIGPPGGTFVSPATVGLAERYPQRGSQAPFGGPQMRGSGGFGEAPNPFTTVVQDIALNRKRRRQNVATSGRRVTFGGV